MFRAAAKTRRFLRVGTLLLRRKKRFPDTSDAGPRQRFAADGGTSADSQPSGISGPVIGSQDTPRTCRLRPPTDESAVLRKDRAGSRIARPSRHSAAHAGRAAPKRRRPLHPAKGPVCAARRPVRFCVRNIRQLVFPISCYGRKRKSSFTVPVANLEILTPA